MSGSDQKATLQQQIDELLQTLAGFAQAAEQGFEVPICKLKPKSV